MKILVLFSTMFALSAAIPMGCADDTASKGGSCTIADTSVSPALTTCMEKEDKNLNIESECNIVNGSFSTSACNPAGFARRCRQMSQVNGVDTVYLYFWQAGSDMTCVGTETTL